MTEIASTIINTKDWYNSPSVIGRVDTIRSFKAPWNFVPLIDESWDEPSTVDTFDNGGDGLSIGTPGMPGFYSLEDAGGISGRDMYMTWRTIDIENFSEFYIWCDNIYTVANIILMHPMFAIEDGHDKFRFIPSSFRNYTNENYFQCYQGKGTSTSSFPLDGILGIGPYYPDHYKNYNNTSYERQSEIPRLDPFPCMGKYMKLAFANFVQTSPRAATFVGVNHIDRLGVFIR